MPQDFFIGVDTGTITTGSLSNVAMVNAGTIVIPTGTITTIVAGTQNTLGTIGVINNLVKGTITALETGTLTALAVGTVGGKAASGAGAVANPVLIAGTDVGGTIYAPIVTSAGALSVSGASAGTFVNIVTGTQQTLGTVGVVNSGTIYNEPKPARDIISFGTTTTGTIGTLVAAPGVGTAIYVNDVSVAVHNGTSDAGISWGLAAQGNGVLVRGNYIAGGGQQKVFSYQVNNGTTNTALTFNQFTGSGTVTYAVTYWVQ